jgi:hypothetical protein
VITAAVDALWRGDKDAEAPLFLPVFSLFLALSSSLPSGRSNSRTATARSPPLPRPSPHLRPLELREDPLVIPKASPWRCASPSCFPACACSGRCCQHPWSRHRAFPDLPHLANVLLVSTRCSCTSSRHRARSPAPFRCLAGALPPRRPCRWPVQPAVALRPMWPLTWSLALLVSRWQGYR